MFIFIIAVIYPFHSVSLYDKPLCLHILNRCLHCCPQMLNKSYIYSGTFARLARGKQDSIRTEYCSGGICKTALIVSFYIWKLHWNYCQNLWLIFLRADRCSPTQHHDQEGVYQHQGALAPAQRERCLRRAPQAHPHPSSREEAEQERDPASGHALHQLPGAAVGEPERPADGPLPRSTAHPAQGEHGAAAVTSTLLGPDQWHRGPLTWIQLRQLRGLVEPPLQGAQVKNC